MEGNKIQLKVLGITFSQVQAGAYALVLSEVKGIRRVPIIIGTPEAQSIAIYLEGLHTPRPLTHDLFVSFADALGAKMKEVNIYKFEDGVFFSELIFMQGDKIITMDSRTSDAIALAIRTDTPIFTNESIMQEAGIIMEDKDEDDLSLAKEEATLSKTFEEDYNSMNTEELRKQLEEAVKNENYEKASKLRDIINSRIRK